MPVTSLYLQSSRSFWIGVVGNTPKSSFEWAEGEFQDSLGYMTLSERRGDRGSLGYMVILSEEKEEEGEI